MKQLFIFVLTGLLAFPAFAQEDYNLVREGNKYYKAKKFTEAEIAYRKGLEKNPKSFEAGYNLGNALFKQEKYAEALEQYQQIVAGSKESKLKLASAFHNTGNSLLSQKKIAESIEAYKQALKLNPKDDDTRYNLAYAQHLLKNQQKQKEKPKDDKQKKKEEKKEEKPQPKQPEMTKEQARQMLEALMQDEKETMEKAKKQPKATRKGSEKDW